MKPFKIEIKATIEARSHREMLHILSEWILDQNIPAENRREIDEIVIASFNCDPPFKSEIA